MQLKGMFKNCAELIRKRWEWLEAAQSLRLDYLGYDFYPEENEGVQDQAFKWRPLLIPVLLQSICDSFGRRNSKDRPVPRRIARQVAVPAGW
jgi:hypothetical protein